MGLVDPLEATKTCALALKMLHNDSIDDYTSLLNVPNVASDDSDSGGSILVEEPVTAFIPCPDLMKKIINAIRVYGNCSKEELFYRFAF